MIVARVIGRGVTLYGGIILALIGVVLIILGAVASPASVGEIVIGVALIVVGALLVLDALGEKATTHSSS